MQRTDFLISPLKNNGVVIYINDRLFPFLKIVNRINQLYVVCFDSQYINLEKNNTLILYMDMENLSNKAKILEIYGKDIEKAFDVVNRNPQNILGFLKCERYISHLEIYDVCLDVSQRGTGIMYALFQNLQEIAPRIYKYFWLGVKFDNPLRDNALKLYTKSGFIFDGIGFFKNADFPVISMINRRDKQNTRQNIEQNTKQNIEQNIGSLIYSGLDKIKCDFNLNLRWQDMIKVQNKYSQENVEYGGKLNMIPNSRNKKEILLTPNYESIVMGDFNYTVNIPNYRANWHSHPNICYQKDNCYIGWPSGQDMKYIFYNYPSGLLIHLLFTAEGLYVINLTLEAMKFIYIIGKNSDWIKSISELINLRFTYLEQYRSIMTDQQRIDCLAKTNSLNCLFYPSENKDVNIIKFIERANNYTLNKYIIREVGRENDFFQKIIGIYPYFPIAEVNAKSLEAIEYYQTFTGRNVDFPIFQVKYYSSHYINANQNSIEKIPLSSIISPIQGFCPKNSNL